MTQLRSNIVTAVATLAVFFAVTQYLEMRGELKRLQQAAVSTGAIIQAPLPDSTKKNQERLQTGSRTIKEKLTGTTVQMPSEGTGPTYQYTDTLKTDTAMASVTWNERTAQVMLQVPDSTGQNSTLTRLPDKDIGKCQKVTIASNGTTYCDKPVLGILDAFAAAAVGIGQDTVSVDSRLGLSWKPDKSKTWQLELYGKPTELLGGNKQLYVGFSKTFNILGR